MAKKLSTPMPPGLRNKLPIVCPPERQDRARSFRLPGLLCRAAVLFAAVFGLALFTCDAFLLTETHDGPLSVRFLALISAAAVAYFALLTSGWIGRWIALGLTAVGLIVLCSSASIAQLADILVQSVVLFINLCLTRLIALGYSSMQLLLIPQENAGVSAQAAVFIGAAVLIVLLAAVFVPCLIARTRLLLPALTGTALLVLVFVFNINRLNWAFALVIAAFSAILVLAAFDRRYLRPASDCDDETVLIQPSGDAPAARPMPPHLARAAGRRAEQQAARTAPTVDEEIAYYVGSAAKKDDSAPRTPEERTAERDYYASLRAVRRYAHQRERERIAAGGFAGLGMLLIALLILALPASLAEQQFTEINFINEHMETARRVLTAYLAGDTPVLDDLLYAGQASNLTPQTTDATRRSFTGEPIFEIETQYATNLYLRGWVATDYRDGMWYSAEEEALDQYRRTFGTTAFFPEQMRVSFYRAVDPKLLSYTDYVNNYQNNLEHGFITLQVNMRRVGSGSNMLFLPAYFNPEIGLVEYASGDASSLSFINYYDGIYTGRAFMPGTSYGVVSYATLMRDSTFMDTLAVEIEAYRLACRGYDTASLLVTNLHLGESAVYRDGDFAIEVSYAEPGYSCTLQGGTGRYNDNSVSAAVIRKAEEILSRMLNMTEYERSLLSGARKYEALYHDHVYAAYTTAPISRAVQTAVDEAVSSATEKQLDNTSRSADAVQSAAAYTARHAAVMEIVQWLSGWVETDELDAEGKPISRRRFNYTLDPTVPLDPALDGVDNFLSVTHEGYCVQFASAAVLMLRHLGIPARYVEGYIATNFTRTAADSSQRYLSIVRDNNAHAWIEVYYDGIGWLNYEATPAYVGDMYAFGSGSGNEPTPINPMPEPPPEEEPDIFDSIDPEELLRLEREQAAREARERLIRILVTVGLCLLVLALLVLTVVLILRATHRADRERKALLAAVRRGLPDDEIGREAARLAAVRLIDEVTLLLAVFGLAPAVGEQRSAYAARLAPEFGPLCPIPLTDLFDAMGAEEFGPGMTDDSLRALGAFRAALGQTAKKRIGLGRRLYYRYIKHLL